MVIFKMEYVVEKHKGGKTYRYWQPKKQYLVGGDWVKCPFKPVSLKGDWILRASELNDALKKWRDGYEVNKIAEGSVSWLIGQYKKDPLFQSLRDTTQKTYLCDLRAIENIIGDIPVKAVSRMSAKAICNSFSANPRKPSAIAGMGQILFQFAIDIEATKENPFQSLRIAKAKPRETVWTMETFEILRTKANELGLHSIALAIQLGLDTGQRSSDLRLLTWNRYEGGRIKLRQSKTGVWVSVRVMKELSAMLAKTERKAPAILINEDTGQPYTKDTLCRKFREVCEAAGVGKELQFRDLRRTSVVRLAESGCEIPEICAITGHTLKSATEILKVYLPTNSKMADNGIDKLEKVGTAPDNSRFAVGTTHEHE